MDLVEVPPDQVLIKAWLVWKIVFSAGILIWYVIMARAMYKGREDAITRGMFWLFVGWSGESIWQLFFWGGWLYPLLTPPTPLYPPLVRGGLGGWGWLQLAGLIPDGLMTAAISYFMWHLKLKDIVRRVIHGTDDSG